MPCQLFILKLLLTESIIEYPEKDCWMYINGKVDNVDCAVVFMLISIIRRREEEGNHYRQIPFFYSGFMEN